MANYDYGRSLTGLSFYGPNPDVGGLGNNGVPSVYPEISFSGHCVVLKATVALNIGDALILDASNTKQVTKSTAGGVFAGICVGSYGNTVGGLHSPSFVVGPAAGGFAIVQMDGVGSAIAGSAITIGQYLTFSAAVAGRLVPLAGGTNTTIVGAAAVSQATSGSLFAAILSVANGTGAGSQSGSFAPTAFFTAGTFAYTPPAGSTHFTATILGGGGGGGGGISTPHNGGAGAPGGSITGAIFLRGSNSPFAIVVGAAGTAGSATGPTNGGNGGASTITDTGSLNTVSAGGGGGGVAATSGGNGAAGAAASNSDTADGVVETNPGVSSTTGGALGGAGGIAATAGAVGMAGSVIIQPY